MNTLRGELVRPYRCLVPLVLLAGVTVAQDPTVDVPQVDFRPAPELPPINVLIIVGDDMGVETVGAYAEHPDPGRTPVLDGLAANGVLFRNGWSSPSCSPSRANILTGKQGWRTQIGSVIDPTFDLELSPGERSLADVLALQGYRTAATGKWHLAVNAESGAQHPLLLGFEHHAGALENIPNGNGDNYFEWDKITDGVASVSTEYATTETVDDTIGYINAFGQDPWFVYLAFHAPHSPYHAPPRGLHTYDLPPEPIDDYPMHAHAMAEAMDTEIGRLLESMDPLVLARTLIIFVGDNGTAPPAVIPPWVIPQSKNSVYEGGINVPFIVAGPGVARGGESAALVHITDIFATVAELTGADASTALDSVSFASALADPGSPSPRTWVHAERFRPNGGGPWVTFARAVRNHRFKLRKHWINGVLEETELFDLLSDPLEVADLLADGISPAEQTVLDNLEGLMAGIGGGPP